MQVPKEARGWFETVLCVRSEQRGHNQAWSGLQSSPSGKSQSQIVVLNHAAEPKHVYRSIPPWSDLAWREMKDLGIG